jgi:hypothetical protein
MRPRFCFRSNGTAQLKQMLLQKHTQFAGPVHMLNQTHFPSLIPSRLENFVDECFTLMVTKEYWGQLQSAMTVS